MMVWHRFLSTLIVISVLFQLCASQLDIIKVDPKNGLFIDSLGRYRIFHGVNAVYKAFPWLPTTDNFDPFNSISEQDMENLQSWGMNVVRLGVMWPGVEPAPQQYNDTYLSMVTNLINKMGQYGIYTMVDFHQDLLHPNLCGEGIPDHALKITHTTCDGSVLPSVAKIFGACKPLNSLNLTIDPSTGFPTHQSCTTNPFWQYYASPDVGSAFDSLYFDDSVQSSLLSYWQVLAKTFSENPYVMGYDILNEPWVGDVWKNPNLIKPGWADLNVLQPFYTNIHKAIRNYDQNHVILYEPVQMPDAIPVLGVFPAGFNQAPGGTDYADRQALSYHVYCCETAVDACDKSGNPRKDNVCDQYNPHKVDVRTADSMRLGGGGFITEFGAVTNTPAGRAEITRTAKAADDKFQSWAYWQFKYFNDITTQSDADEGFYGSDTIFQVEKVKALARTYAQAIQGPPTRMIFEPTTSSFVLKYTLTPSIKGTTDIFLSQEFYYPSGYEVKFSDARMEYLPSPATSQIKVFSNQITNPMPVAVAIIPYGLITTTYNTPEKDNLIISVSPSSNSTATTATTITFSAPAFMNRWKSLNVYDSFNHQVCSLSLPSSNHMPVVCTLDTNQQKKMNFNYRIELWKAKNIIGNHYMVDTLQDWFLGPLEGRSVNIYWHSD